MKNRHASSMYSELKKEADWKPATNVSYETVVLTDTTLN